MQDQETKGHSSARFATLKLTHAPDSTSVLSARLPSDVTREEFARVTSGAYDLISKLTGHPCMSGRIKFVVDDPIINEVLRVDLRTGVVG